MGYANAVNLIESKFKNIKYFPVSSMGHEADYTHYEPWGVLDPMFWLITSNPRCPLCRFFLPE